MISQQTYSVSEAASVINQTLEYAYPTITVIGEVTEYKVSGGKWAFFYLKDDEMGIKCFSAIWNIRTEIEDGMMVKVVAKPRLGKYGFSLNIDSIKPVGEGSIKKAFELLRNKLDAEGLFAVERKRALPSIPMRIGVISSTAAAGYKDFIKILNKRFSGIMVEVADTAVQGESSADQIIKALRFFNESENPPEIIAILRGGGARGDLVAFDDEALVREVAASRVPVITGIGHEIDMTLTDLVADVRASTPSHAAEMIIPDRREIIAQTESQLKNFVHHYATYLQSTEDILLSNMHTISNKIDIIFDSVERRTESLTALLHQLNPKTILKNGYAIVRDIHGQILSERPLVGDEINVETYRAKFSAKIDKIL